MSSWDRVSHLNLSSSLKDICETVPWPGGISSSKELNRNRIIAWIFSYCVTVGATTSLVRTKVIPIIEVFAWRLVGFLEYPPRQTMKKTEIDDDFDLDEEEEEDRFSLLIQDNIDSISVQTRLPALSNNILSDTPAILMLYSLYGSAIQFMTVWENSPYQPPSDVTLSTLPILPLITNLPRRFLDFILSDPSKRASILLQGSTVDPEDLVDYFPSRFKKNFVSPFIHTLKYMNPNISLVLDGPARSNDAESTNVNNKISLPFHLSSAEKWCRDINPLLSILSLTHDNIFDAVLSSWAIVHTHSDIILLGFFKDRAHALLYSKNHHPHSGDDPFPILNSSPTLKSNTGMRLSAPIPNTPSKFNTVSIHKNDRSDYLNISSPILQPINYISVEAWRSLLTILLTVLLESTSAVQPVGARLMKSTCCMVRAVSVCLYHEDSCTTFNCSPPFASILNELESILTCLPSRESKLSNKLSLSDRNKFAEALSEIDELDAQLKASDALCHLLDIPTEPFDLNPSKNHTSQNDSNNEGNEKIYDEDLKVDDTTAQNDNSKSKKIDNCFRVGGKIPQWHSTRKSSQYALCVNPVLLRSSPLLSNFFSPLPSTAILSTDTKSSLDQIPGSWLGNLCISDLRAACTSPSLSLSILSGIASYLAFRMHSLTDSEWQHRIDSILLSCLSRNLLVALPPCEINRVVTLLSLQRDLSRPVSSKSTPTFIIQSHTKKLIESWVRMETDFEGGSQSMSPIPSPVSRSSATVPLRSSLQPSLRVSHDLLDLTLAIISKPALPTLRTGSPIRSQAVKRILKIRSTSASTLSSLHALLVSLPLPSPLIACLSSVPTPPSEAIDRHAYPDHFALYVYHMRSRGLASGLVPLSPPSPANVDETQRESVPRLSEGDGEMVRRIFDCFSVAHALHIIQGMIQNAEADMDTQIGFLCENTASMNNHDVVATYSSRLRSASDMANTKDIDKSSTYPVNISKNYHSTSQTTSPKSQSFSPPLETNIGGFGILKGAVKSLRVIASTGEKLLRLAGGGDQERKKVNMVLAVPAVCESLGTLGAFLTRTDRSHADAANNLWAAKDDSVDIGDAIEGNALLRSWQKLSSKLKKEKHASRQNQPSNENELLPFNEAVNDGMKAVPLPSSSASETRNTTLPQPSTSHDSPHFLSTSYPPDILPSSLSVSACVTLLRDLLVVCPETASDEFEFARLVASLCPLHVPLTTNLEDSGSRIKSADLAHKLGEDRHKYLWVLSLFLRAAALMRIGRHRYASVLLQRVVVLQRHGWHDEQFAAWRGQLALAECTVSGALSHSRDVRNYLSRKMKKIENSLNGDYFEEKGGANWSVTDEIEGEKINWACLNFLYDDSPEDIRRVIRELTTMPKTVFDLTNPQNKAGDQKDNEYDQLVGASAIRTNKSERKLSNDRSGSKFMSNFGSALLRSGNLYFNGTSYGGFNPAEHFSLEEAAKLAIDSLSAAKEGYLFGLVTDVAREFVVDGKRHDDLVKSCFIGVGK